MELWLDGLKTALPIEKAAESIMKTNEYTEKFGLVLTEDQALRLCAARAETLKREGRVEFGKSAVDALILAFCDSPFVSNSDYEDTLHELIRIFYEYKNETGDLISDELLIAAMREFYDGSCRGDLELLETRELDGFARSIRDGSYFRKAAKHAEEEEESDE